MVFILSFLATAYTCITFGVSCKPFKANWEDVPGSKCLSKDFIVITNQVNAGINNLDGSALVLKIFTVMLI